MRGTKVAHAQSRSESLTSGSVHTGTQTDKCGWPVTPRQLLVKSSLAIRALIELTVFSQASSASFRLQIASSWAEKILISCYRYADLANPPQEKQVLFDFIYSGISGQLG